MTFLPLCEEFARGVNSQCSYTLLQLRYLPVSLIRIKIMQIGNHKIKVVNYANGTTIFLRDIACLNRIQVILELYEDTSSSKINFSNAKPYGLERIKVELMNQDKWNGQNFPLKYLELKYLELSNFT